MKILITAFGAFGKSPINSSEEVAKAFRDREDVVISVLPVSYKQAETMIVELINKHRPNLLLMLGQAGADRKIRVENLAINRRDVALADIDGYIAYEELIDEKEPMVLFAPCAVCQLRDEMKEQGLQAKRSNTAGLFVCNATFFKALTLQKHSYPHMPVVFLHYPMLPEQKVDYPERYTMPLTDMVRAAQIVIDYYGRENNVQD